MRVPLRIVISIQQLQNALNDVRSAGRVVALSVGLVEYRNALMIQISNEIVFFGT